MDKKKIEEAVGTIKKSHPYAVKYKGVKEDEALQTLLTLAQSYLKISGEGIMGGEAVVSHNYDPLNKLKAEQKGVEFVWADGFNACRHETILRIMGVEEKIEEVVTNWLSDVHYVHLNPENELNHFQIALKLKKI